MHTERRQYRPGAWRAAVFVCVPSAAGLVEKTSMQLRFNKALSKSRRDAGTIERTLLGMYSG